MDKRSWLSKTWQSFSLWFNARAKDVGITFVGLVIIFFGALYIHFFAPASWEKNTKVVIIPTGTSFQDISRILEENGIVRDRRTFYLFARITGAIPKVKAGEYEVNTSMRPNEVLDKLIRGEVIQYPVTIPEGYDIYQIADVLERAKVCNKQLFIAKARDRSLISSLGLEVDNLEGYLFPDTYNFPKGHGEEQIIRQMIARFHSVFRILAKRAGQLGLNEREVVILASMIEKEAVDDQERRLISAVFHNRLHRGMALQSDPTAIYGVKTGNAARERITKQDLMKKTPYNTYIINGLPKGPIANPGLKSLEAALYPADVNYLYFVSKNDKTHYFSTTLEEHNRAVNRYQRKIKRKS
ncbi:MAG: endolytic transglycosylase MltG [Deltaproteobacteria bacterium]|nr:endolytic transglycosylase MltG [Deltaproteobacteria bacterium]